ncbi:MAG: PAS domain-containing protein [Phycisphaerales bacterium]|nr:PAS domain-containing protein [Phycisphaerales bacterium]
MAGLSEIEHHQRIVESLLDAATRLQSAADESEAARIVAEGVASTGWATVIVSIYDEAFETVALETVGVDGPTRKRILAARGDERSRRAIFGRARDRFLVGRFYFIPEEAVESLGLSGIVIPTAEAPDGEWRARDHAYAPLRDTGGAVIGRVAIDAPASRKRPTPDSLKALSSFIDLASRTIEGLRLRTALGEAEALAERSSVRWRRLVENLNVVAWEGSPDSFDFTYVSAHAERLLGYSVREWLAPGFWVSRLHPEDRERAIDYCQSQTKLGKGHDFEYRMIARDGRVVWIRDSVSLIYESGGNVAQICGFLIDITENKAAEQVRAEQANHLRLVVEQLPAVLWTLDRDLRFTTSEGRGLEGLGLAPAQVVGMPLGEYLQTNDPEFPPYAAHVRALSGESATFEFTSPLGTTFGCHVEPMYGDTGQIVGVIGVGLDVTERRRAELESMRARELLQRITDAVPVKIARIDSELRYTFANATYERWHGRGPDQIVGLHVREFVGDEAFEVAEPYLRRGLAGETVLFESASFDRANAITHVRCLLTPDRDPYGNVQGVYSVTFDITDRVRAEQQQSEHASRLRLMIEQMPAIMWATDVDLRFVSIEGRALEAVGIRPEESIGKTLFEFYGTEDRTYPALAAHLRAVTGSHENYQCELQGRSLEVHVEPLNDDRGRIIGTIGVALDVTERKRAEHQRSEQANRLRLMIEQMPAIIWTTDRNLRFTSIDGRGLEALGQRPGEQVEMSLFEFFGTDDRDFAPIAAHLRAVGGSLENYEIEWQGCSFEVHVEPLNDDHGRIIGTIGVALDVTGRKRAEMESISIRTQLQQITDAIPVQIGYLDDRFIYRFNNATYEKWHNKPRSQITGRHMSELVSASGWERIQQFAARAMRGEAVQFESSIADGRLGGITHVRTSLTPDTDASGKTRGLFLVTTDISDRVHAERSLSRALDRQTDLLRELNHRVKNSMAGLLSLIDLSRDREQSVEQFADAISLRVRGMTRVHSLLSSREWQSIELDAVISSLIPTHTNGEVIASGPRVAIPPGLATATGMLFQELFSNSLRHGALDSPSGRVSVTWDIERTKHHSVLTLDWRETGGPTIPQEPATGLGTELIRGFARHELRGSIELRFPPEGAHHTLVANFDWSATERPKLD